MALTLIAGTPQRRQRWQQPWYRSAERPVPERSLIIACGALAREISSLIAINRWSHIELQCLNASLHNTPAEIPRHLAEKIQVARGHYRRILIAYADCGTAGEIDRLIETEDNVSRMPGAHCFAAFAGIARYESMMNENPGTFWLTDFLVKHFKSMVIDSLGLEDHPELKALYFDHYNRVVYLSQADDEVLLASAEAAADFLGLAFEHLPTGYGEIEQSVRWSAA